MAAADGRGEPPPLLVLHWSCRRYGALPEAGGILDQDHRQLTVMQALSNIYDAVTAVRSAKGHDIHNLPASVNQIVNSLWAAGYL